MEKTAFLMSQAGMHKEYKLTSVFVYPSVNLKVFSVLHCSKRLQERSQLSPLARERHGLDFGSRN